MPRARHTDPFTSHLAADSVMDVTALQIRIMQVFELSQGLTDEELIDQYRRTFGLAFPASDSSLRSRRAELRDKNYLRATTRTRRTANGGQSIVWDIYGRLL